MARLGFPLSWFVLAAILCRPLYWLMVDAPWGLRSMDQLTVERQFAVFGFIALITGVLAWISNAWRRNVRRVQRAST